MKSSSRIIRTIGVCAAAVIASLASAPALACDCVEESLADAARRHDLIFLGHVTGVKKSKDINADVKVSVKVERAWKGQLAGEVTIFTAGNDALCGYEFAAGHDYLIYAGTSGKNGPSVSLCSRTKRANIAGPDQTWLNRKFPSRK